MMVGSMMLLVTGVSIYPDMAIEEREADLVTMVMYKDHDRKLFTIFDYLSKGFNREVEVMLGHQVGGELVAVQANMIQQAQIFNYQRFV